MRQSIFAWIAVIGMIFTCAELMAQDRLSYGFKAGLSSSTFSGPLSAEENFKGNIGFHLGIIFRYAFTDRFGIKGEFMYSQKGGDYFYDGPSSFLLQRDPSANNSVLLSGTRDMNVNVSNDYLDFPFTLYARFGAIEFSGGLNVGFLAGSTGGGQMTFSSQIPAIDPFTQNLDHRYFGDDAREATPISSITVELAGEPVTIAKQSGAYYEYAEKRGSLYNRLDFGLNAGVSFYLNQGLYLGFRYNHGLTDVTSPDADVTWKTFDGDSPAYQNDKDLQISYQFSLGFSF